MTPTALGGDTGQHSGNPVYATEADWGTEAALGPVSSNDPRVPQSPRRGSATVPSLRQVANPRVVMWGVALLAFAIRLLPSLTHRGWLALGRYDDGVYLGMSISFIHAEIPYSDLVMLHPPGIVLALTPLAGLARVFGDPSALVVGRALFMVLGSGTAALVAYLVRERGAHSMWIAGGTYAVFVPAAYADSSITLESLSNLLIAAALVVLARPTHLSDRWLVIGGGLIGLAAATKIWGMIPLLVVAAWTAKQRGGRATAMVLTGGAATITAVCLPYFAAAPREMWRMVVLDQLGRPDTNPGVVKRLPALLGIADKVATHTSNPSATFMLLFAVVAAILVWALIGAVRRGYYLPALLLLSAVFVLVSSPSHFLQYGAFMAVPLAWCVGLSAPRRFGTAVLCALLATSAVTAMRLGPGPTVSGAFAKEVRSVDGCLASDDPTLLIATNTFTRNLARGCKTWVDVTGTAYDINGIKPSDGFYQSRTTNGYWQYGILGPYLESSDGFILGRSSTGVSQGQRDYWMQADDTMRSGRYVLFKSTCTTDRSLRSTPYIPWVNNIDISESEALKGVPKPCALR